MAVVERLTGLAWRRQGPPVLIGLGHGGTHWIAGTFYVLLPFVAITLELDYAAVGVLVALFHGSAAATNLVSGPVVDITGRRVPVQVVSLLIGAAALAGLALAPGPLAMGLLVIVIGFSNNLWHPAAISFLSQRYPGQRGYVLSVHALGANAGDAVAPLVAGIIIAWVGWRGAAVGGALPALLIAGIIAILLWRGDRGGGVARGGGMAGYGGAVLALARAPAVFGLCLAAGFRTMTQVGLFTFLPLYLANDLGVGPVLLGLALSAMQSAGLIAAPVAGVWSDRIGRRPVVVAGLGIATAVIAVLALIPSPPLFIAGVSLLGFALFAVRPVVHGWLLDLSPPSMTGAATSLMFGCQAVMGALAPIIGGLVADRYGLAPVFYGLAGSMLIANLISTRLPEGRAAGGAHRA